MNIPTAVPSLIFALAVMSGLAFGSVARAETVQFPKDDPSLKIEVPAGWKVDWIDATSKETMASGGAMGGTRLQLSAAAGDLAIKELPEDAGIEDDESAKANLTKMALKDMKDFEASKCSDPAETKVAGHKAYTTKVTTGLGSMDYTIFTADGEIYFAMFSMGGGADPVIAAIKAVE